MQPHRIFAAAAAIVVLGTTPAFTQGKSGNAAQGGAPTNTASAPNNHAGGAPKTNSRGGPKNTPASGAAAKNVAATSNANAPKNSGNSLGTSQGASKNVASAPPASNVPNTTGDNIPTPTANAFANTPNTMPTPPTTPNKVSTKLTGNPAQLARVQAMLPAGMTLEQASSGFRNRGQFLAALNASKNRGLPFADLQKAMTVDGLSLGQAAKLLQNAPVLTPGNATPNTPGTNANTVRP